VSLGFEPVINCSAVPMQ